MNTETKSPSADPNAIVELLKSLGIQNPSSFQFQEQGVSVVVNLNGPIHLPKESVDQLMKLIQQNAKREAGSSGSMEVSKPALGAQNHRLAYSAKEAAKLIGVSPKTIHRLIDRGLLRSSPILRHKLIPKSDLERLLANEQMLPTLREGDSRKRTK